MISTKINIKLHLAEYIRGKYNHSQEGPVSLPHDSDLYVIVWDLMAKRPVNAPVFDAGTLEIALPNLSYGKKPEYYNYLSPRAASLIEQYIEAILYAELHQRFREGKRKGITYLDTAFHFKNEYGITGITEDAFLKDYYRFRRAEEYRRKQQKKAKNYV